MNAEAGNKAPAFTLEDANGAKTSLKDLVGKGPLVLYFYPKDMTSGCTAEACGFRDADEPMRKLAATVVGVSPDNPATHAKFIAKENLNFTLLADPDHAACEKYGVWVEKSMYGRKYMGVERSTFLIDKQGKIARVWRGVKVNGHVDEVVEAIKALKS